MNSAERVGSGRLVDDVHRLAAGNRDRLAGADDAFALRPAQCLAAALDDDQHRLLDAQALEFERLLLQHAGRGGDAGAMEDARLHVVPVLVGKGRAMVFAVFPASTAGRIIAASTPKAQRAPCKVRLALPRPFAQLMKPTSAGVALGGKSSFSNLSACTVMT